MKRCGAFVLLLCIIFVTLTAIIPISATATPESTEKLQTKGYVLADSTSTHSDSSYDLPNGMSMFYLLSDGTFLVFDGGQGTDTASIDAHHLYKQLKAVADENEIDDIVFSA